MSLDMKRFGVIADLYTYYSVFINVCLFSQEAISRIIPKGEKFFFVLIYVCHPNKMHEKDQFIFYSYVTNSNLLLFVHAENFHKIYILCL